jgi:DNA ligase (NAD+)
MSDILLYTSKDGRIELNVSLSDETVWLTQKQLADLFGTKRPAITKHLRNIFNSQELSEDTVCSILEHTASDGKKYNTKFYNLDAIISVGYRINSSQATQFRMWATQILKQHLIKGYTIHKVRLAEQGLHELKQTVELLQTTLVKNELINDIGNESIQLIISYAKTWNILLAYDEDKLELGALNSSLILCNSPTKPIISPVDFTSTA